MTDLVPVPATGRRFVATRKVRLGDASPEGRLRFDAIARYLQDVANDDATDAGLEGAMAWVVRKLTISVVGDRAPRIGEWVALTTFCGGYGSRWAERRTSLAVDGRALVEAAALWVFVDPVSGRPKSLTDQFHDTYGEAAGGRTVGSRLSHPPPPDGAQRRPWVVRRTDFDVLGHVNNAIALAVVEDRLPAAADLTDVEVEYRSAIGPGDAVEAVTAGDRLWLTVGGDVRVSVVGRVRA